MPIYEYECPHCEARFEVLVNGSGRGVREGSELCPECGLRGAKKVMSPTNFALKGQGWYKTDYGSTPPPSKPPQKHE